MKFINYNGTNVEYHRNTIISIFENTVNILSDNKEYNFKHNNNNELIKCVQKFRKDYEKILDDN